MPMKPLMGYNIRSTLFYNLLGMKKNTTNKFRFRGDSREASMIFSEGFAPNGDNTSIISHVKTPANSFYVSTTYSIAQSVKYGGLHKTIYAAQPPIVTNVQLSFIIERANPSLMEGNANIYATFESEAAAAGQILPEHIYASQEISGFRLLHLSAPIQYNPSFKPLTFEIEIPSAQGTEVQAVENYLSKNNALFPELTNGQRFIRIEDAKTLAEALSYHAANFNVGNTPNVPRQVIRTIPSNQSEDQVVTTVLKNHHDFMIENYSRNNRTVFFSQSSQNKTEILDKNKEQATANQNTLTTQKQKTT